MHSYIKRSNFVYEVGIWLAANTDSAFQGMFTVKSFARAVDAVNMLNGGAYTFDAFAKLEAKELE
jgi:hypothetical protein